MSEALQFSLNRMSAPKLGFADYLALCLRLGIHAIEIRNDLPGIEMTDGRPAAQITAACEAAGMTILSINALQRFEQFDATRQSEAVALARYAADCGAKALVLCPTNTPLDTRTPAQRHADLVAALKQLKPILEDHGLLGLVETLGFEECALRRKSDAVKGIYEAAGERHFKLVHDTFHHHLAGEEIFYPDLTGLVHISGVEETALNVADMRDGHRVLVGRDDRLGNVRQLAVLRGRGYRGYAAFEPFADEIAQAADIEQRIAASMSHIREGLESESLREVA
jgi:2-keto-myo-inositol isomerase